MRAVFLLADRHAQEETYMKNINTRRGNTQNEKEVSIYKNYHFRYGRPQESGIHNDCCDDKKEKALLNEYVEDPRLQISAMTANFNTPSPAPTGRPLPPGARGTTETPVPQGAKGTACGFTLIELLVVVLIIGILAAVALPQYQVTIAKSRVAAILPFGKALKDAKEAYYLQANTYTRDTNVLDIKVPDSCKPVTYTGYYSCGDFFVLDNNEYNVSLSYCPGNASSWQTCHPKRDFSIVLTQDHIPPNYPYNYKEPSKIYCNVYRDSSFGKEVCKKFPDFLYTTYEFNP